MNIEKAKQVPIENILETIGHFPNKKNERDLWYISPFRNEETPSFHVNVAENVWYDFGEGKGGDSVTLICKYLERQNEDHAVSDALRWISNMSGFSFVEQLQPSVKNEKPNKWILKKVKPIQNQALINYLKSRGITLGIAEKHLKEVYVRHSIKPLGIFALGFKNEDGGYELRNAFMKTCVYPKNITFIRATEPNPKGINIFEGVMDFLAASTRYPEMIITNDNITLNSAAVVEMAFPYIAGYGYQFLYNWTDNDNAGKAATVKIKDFVATQEGLKHKPMNAIYSPYKDVNEWHVQTLIL